MKSHKEIAERLKERGLRHWYEYFTLGGDKPSKRATPATTVAILSFPLSTHESGLSSLGSIICAASQCSPMDRFVKAKGREVSLRRALIKARDAELITNDDIAYCMSGGPK